MSLFESASLVVTPNGTKASKLYAIKPTSGAGDLSVTRATTATRVNASGLIESVANNIPRLDYTNSTCPSILVEPQRTNLVLNSQDFSNASWYNVNTTITTNSIASPDGNLTADLCSYTSSTNVLSFLATNSINSDYTISVFAKKGTGNILRIRETFYFGTGVVFNLNLGTVISGTGKIENYGNGWYRCSITKSYLSSQTRLEWSFDSNENINNLYLWGAQIEAGSYATSYIPTTSASVTRNADVISKTGISDLIGQTEGTLFFDGIVNNIQNANSNILNTNKSADTISTFQLSKSKSDNKFRFDLFLGNGTFTSVTLNSTNSFNNGTRTKIAIRYKSGNFAMYINGNLEATSSSTFTNIGTKTELFLNDSVTYFNFQESVSFNLVSLWKNGLTNSELATLTTI